MGECRVRLGKYCPQTLLHPIRRLLNSNFRQETSNGWGYSNIRTRIHRARPAFTFTPATKLIKHSRTSRMHELQYVPKSLSAYCVVSVQLSNQLISRWHFHGLRACDVMKNNVHTKVSIMCETKYMFSCN
jgi:hypothetical protein